MADTDRWARAPRPDPDVIRILEQALGSARKGHVRAVTIVLVNPLHEVESASAAPHATTWRHALIGGLSSAAHKLLKELSPD
jgi:hypothetical protein